MDKRYVPSVLLESDLGEEAVVLALATQRVADFVETDRKRLRVFAALAGVLGLAVTALFILILLKQVQVSEAYPFALGVLAVLGIILFSACGWLLVASFRAHAFQIEGLAKLYWRLIALPDADAQVWLINSLMTSPAELSLVNLDALNWEGLEPAKNITRVESSVQSQFELITYLEHIRNVLREVPRTRTQISLIPNGNSNYQWLGEILRKGVLFKTSNEPLPFVASHDSSAPDAALISPDLPKLTKHFLDHPYRARLVSLERQTQQLKASYDMVMRKFTEHEQAAIALTTQQLQSVAQDMNQISETVTRSLRSEIQDALDDLKRSLQSEKDDISRDHNRQISDIEEKYNEDEMDTERELRLVEKRMTEYSSTIQKTNSEIAELNDLSVSAGAAPQARRFQSSQERAEKQSTLERLQTESSAAQQNYDFESANHRQLQKAREEKRERKDKKIASLNQEKAEKLKRAEEDYTDSYQKAEAHISQIRTDLSSLASLAVPPREQMEPPSDVALALETIMQYREHGTGESFRLALEQLGALLGSARQTEEYLGSHSWNLGTVIQQPTEMFIPFWVLKVENNAKWHTQKLRPKQSSDWELLVVPSWLSIKPILESQDLGIQPHQMPPENIEHMIGVPEGNGFTAVTLLAEWRANPSVAKHIQMDIQHLLSQRLVSERLSRSMSDLLKVRSDANAT